MSSTDGDDYIRLSNEILESRRRTRLSRAIATIGFAAGAALTGGVATGAWLYFLGFFALIDPMSSEIPERSSGACL